MVKALTTRFHTNVLNVMPPDDPIAEPFREIFSSAMAAEVHQILERLSRFDGLALSDFEPFPPVVIKLCPNTMTLARLGHDSIAQY